MTEERGSITPVFIAFLAVVLILVMAFVDREWANYTLAAAENTADFAAEAGAAVHERWATVAVDKRQYFITFRRVCEGVPEVCRDEPVLDLRWEYKPVHARYEDLEERWRELAGCRQAAPGELVYAPEWECASVKITARELRFTGETDAAAKRTFEQNWRERSSARAEVRRISAIGADRKVEVEVGLDLRSLFGLLPWERNLTVVGAAVVQPGELVLK